MAKFALSFIFLKQNFAHFPTQKKKHKYKNTTLKKKSV